MKTSLLCRAVWALGGVLLLAYVTPVAANVVISGTRVVYPANEREVTIKLDNVGNEPALIQAWVDSGDPDSRADQADAPFLLMPPVVRISPQRSQTLRMTYTHDPLPQDVESVFWLNVLDVPPLPKSTDSNFMQVAYRSRVKVFYRPEGLKGYAEDTPAAVIWTLVANGKGFALRGTNPTEFSASYNKTELVVEGKTYSSKGGMIPARGVSEFPLENLQSRPQGSTSVRYEWLNDYGAAKLAETKLAN
ncbi:fimbrial biogenesis chaperone [Pseudomonas mucidolens]|uniref:Chaperone protein EcpD n=1 Tax=Pseudomonas mucidolens TaxID=46679 RepID=A0A1H2N9M7_9PSED|nr:fimbria/pilus periplasmic chaperone [Pseudomonas mucidolens]SDV01871.1 chaperone protein EcpD [Pseudomonas mucidolens]SQH32415.1 chaperone protein ecpD [Pseudomonas mucidolens]